jgi:hypothetical protein
VERRRHGYDFRSTANIIWTAIGIPSKIAIMSYKARLGCLADIPLLSTSQPQIEPSAAPKLSYSSF